MGVSMSGPGGDFYLNWRGWGLMVELATSHGWELPPDVEREEGPDGQMGFWLDDLHRLTDAEAAALATALEQSLDDIPDHEVLRDKGFGAERGVPSHRIGEVSAVEWFSGDNKRMVQQFITFCKAGGFTIR